MREPSFKPAPEIIEETIMSETALDPDEAVILGRAIQNALSKHGYVFYQP